MVKFVCALKVSSLLQFLITDQTMIYQLITIKKSKQNNNEKHHIPLHFT